MTVVNPKSISGINSITMASGSDNLLTIHTTNTTERVRVNSDGDVIVGSGITVSPDGDIFATGVTTSTTFVGGLTGDVTGNVTGNISGGTVAGSTGTFTGNVAVSGANITLQDSGGASDDRLTFGADTDLSIYHDGSNSRIAESGTGHLILTSNGNGVLIQDLSSGQNMAKFLNSGAVELYHNYVKKLSTDSNGVKINSSSLYIDSDNEFVAVGAGDDLKIFHDGTNTNIRNQTGQLYIRSTDVRITNDGVTEHMAKFIENGAVELYHDNSRKFYTESTGINVYGSGSTFLKMGSEAGGTDAVFFDTTHSSNAKPNMIFRLDADETMRLQSTGGISFNGDTAAANALDDYEEGTWTPIFTDDGTSGNSAGSYTHQLGWYSKIGNIVNLQCRISGANTTGMNSSHAAYIKNLPYAIKGSSNRLVVGGLMLSNVNLDSDTMTIGVLSNVGAGAGSDNSYFRMFQTKDNAVWSSITVSSFPSGNHEIQVNFTYRAA